MPKLPRDIEVDQRLTRIEAALARDVRPIWKDAAVRVPHVPFTDSLEKALRVAVTAKQLERGLEHIETRLVREAKGLAAAREKQKTESPNRLSRILVVADDGAERFYRDCEQLLKHHGDRLICLKLAAPAKTLSEKVFGPDELVKAVLVAERDAVVNVLRALA